MLTVDGTLDEIVDDASLATRQLLQATEAGISRIDSLELLLTDMERGLDQVEAAVVAGCESLRQRLRVLTPHILEQQALVGAAENACLADPSAPARQRQQKSVDGVAGYSDFGFGQLRKKPDGIEAQASSFGADYDDLNLRVATEIAKFDATFEKMDKALQDLLTVVDDVSKVKAPVEDFERAAADLPTQAKLGHQALMQAIADAAPLPKKLADQARDGVQGHIDQVRARLEAIFGLDSALGHLRDKEAAMLKPLDQIKPPLDRVRSLVVDDIKPPVQKVDDVLVKLEPLIAVLETLKKLGLV